MGLDIRLQTSRHIGKANSYSGFGKFREWLASKVGITLSEMKGFGGSTEWDNTTSPLYPFLNHSDCDGSLNYDECILTRTGMEEVQLKLTDADDKDMVEQLGWWIDACEKAIGEDGELIFS